MSEWTAEAIAEEIEYRKTWLRAGKCPDSGQEILLDHPLGDAPIGRMCCAMCDCFGYDPNVPLEDQAS